MLFGPVPAGPPRFLRSVGRAEAATPTRPLRLAYADPPYPGNAWLYRDHPDYGGEVDHAVTLSGRWRGILGAIWRHPY